MAIDNDFARIYRLLCNQRKRHENDYSYAEYMRQRELFALLSGYQADSDNSGVKLPLKPAPTEGISLNSKDVKIDAETVITKSKKRDVNEHALDFKEQMDSQVIGQPEVVEAFVRAYKTFLIGMNPPDRPIAVLLLAGATGLGKTHSLQTAARAILGPGKPFTRIDCAEFAGSHEIAKLIGAPPGYLGHRETQPQLAQETIDKFQTALSPINFVLFEIEKASESLWNILLGILDGGRLKLGNGQTTDFSNTILAMTTNLGARELEKIARNQHIGFAKVDAGNAKASADEAINANFSPEFMNRLDSVIIFNQLESQHLDRIFDIEMAGVQERILHAKCPIFILKWTPEARKLLLQEGTSARHGARKLKRVIEQRVVLPLTDMLLAQSIDNADTVTVSVENGEIAFEHSYR